MKKRRDETRIVIFSAVVRQKKNTEKNSGIATPKNPMERGRKSFFTALIISPIKKKY